MSSLPRQLRGLAIALAVLAISAGAAFAAAPSLTLSASHNRDMATSAQGLAAEATESAETSDSPEPSESAEPSDSPEPSESAESTDSPNAPQAAESPSADTHGALVSTAAQMPTPTGFPNHGAFVSCVAHMDVSAVGFDWTTVTPQSCGITQTDSAAPKQHGKSQAAHGKSGMSHGKSQSQTHGRPSSGG